ncbi:PD-(D/E)XK nuclease family protein [Polyangium fumosum]|uniref:PD-(D/E)XK nuclease family protein n=1 Tax=Polyangium fumosum TaxID=889272 RepID=A0A4U1J496_9BACT|nr:PD-(D/E)XK nuclease family protein [Polyangium fumosum]TKD01987.1 hypothetical protein E8A74_29410 [Polyangium fumosum]
MNFESLCALEYMAVADRENVQTGLLAWLLGVHSPLSAPVRAEILGRLTGHNLPPVISTTATTEDGNIDLVVTCHHEDGSRGCVAIENKLKSEESPGQLSSYDLRLATRHVHAKIFLSLLGERPHGGTGWISASYADLAEALDAVSQEKSACDPYLWDAREMLHRLIKAVSLVTTDPEYARHVFPNSPKQPSPPEASFRKYVGTLRLRRVLQRAWCAHLGRSLGSLAPGWSTKTGTGARSAAAHLHVARVVGSGTDTFRVGLAVENLALKAFCHPSPYPKQVSASQKEGVAARLVQIHEVLHLDAKVTPSASRKRGFRSYTLVDKSTELPDINMWTALLDDYYRQMESASW